MIRIASLISLLSIFALASAQNCGQTCKFRLCRANENLNPASIGAFLRPGPPGFPMQPFICKIDGSVGPVVRTGNPLLERGGSRFDLRREGPGFPFKFFVGKKIPTFGFTGIIRKVTTPTQWAYLNRKCFILPIRSYQVVDSSGTVIRTDRATGSDDCVSFRIQAPKVQIDLFWQSDDDFDLSVVEPDNDILSKRTEMTEDGIFRVNNGVKACGLIKIGKEIILYQDDYESGEYIIRVRMNKKCPLSPRRVRYCVKVTLLGNLINSVCRKTRATSGQTVLEDTIILS